MPEMLLILLIAAVIPIAAVAASAFVEGGLRAPAARERGLPRRSALSLVALLSLVSTLVVAENPATAVEGDRHVFSGSITDLEGAALADINVSVFCQGCPDGSTSDPSQNPARPWPAARWGSGARLLGETTTDASGTWSVTVPEPASGGLLIVAWDPTGDYAFGTISARQWTSRSDLNTSLADGGRLSGRISGDAGPWPAAGFVLSGHGNNLLWSGISLVVDANGDYLTPGLPDGQYSLSYPDNLARPYVSSMSYRLGTISGGLDSAADHDLLKYTSVSGRVTDGSGRGLSGIRVVASPVGTVSSLVASPIGGRGTSVETAANGTYSMDDMVPGTAFVIEFSSPDGEYASEYYDDQNLSWEGDHVEIPAEGAVSGIDAQLAPGGRVSGHVRDADGEPASGTGVTLCVEDSYNCTYKSTDGSGFFEFGGLAAATYTLRSRGIDRCVVVAEGRHVQVNLDLGVDQGEFIDVPQDAYYSVPVMTLAEQGVFAGTEWGDGFCPNAPIDRKTMAVWIVRVLDDEDPARVTESRFNDVNVWGFHARFIERMAELGVTRGCGDLTGFCPDRTVTRAEMAVFLSRAYQLADAPDPGFVDVPADAWYATDVAKLAASGITTGCGDRSGFCPGRATTRGEMATFLDRAENRAS